MDMYNIVPTPFLCDVLQVLLEKARVKGQNDNTFTESVLQKLFCNIEDIMDLHRRLMAELKTCLKGGVAYGSPIAGVYLKFVSVCKKVQSLVRGLGGLHVGSLLPSDPV